MPENKKGTVIKGKSNQKLPDSNTDVAKVFSDFLKNIRKKKSPTIKGK